MYSFILCSDFHIQKILRKERVFLFSFYEISENKILLYVNINLRQRKTRHFKRNSDLDSFWILLLQFYKIKFRSINICNSMVNTVKLNLEFYIKLLRRLNILQKYVWFMNSYKEIIHKDRDWDVDFSPELKKSLRIH